MFMTGSHD